MQRWQHWTQVNRNTWVARVVGMEPGHSFDPKFIPSTTKLDAPDVERAGKRLSARNVLVSLHDHELIQQRGGPARGVVAVTPHEFSRERG